MVRAEAADSMRSKASKSNSSSSASPSSTSTTSMIWEEAEVMEVDLEVLVVEEEPNEVAGLFPLVFVVVVEMEEVEV